MGGPRDLVPVARPHRPLRRVRPRPADGRAAQAEGARVHLQDQPFQVLAMLVERAGDLVTRDELKQRLWSGAVFVDFEQGLNNAVAKIPGGRRRLGRAPAGSWSNSRAPRVQLHRQPSSG
ncbi:MAG: winged helix-turn-helix domain-containing protein [Chromatiales bacterium]|nr:winged helix-turn-helix domain-containing protein [Chromatiales bacterium]